MAKTAGPKFASEADLVAAYCAALDRHNAHPRISDDQKWIAYHETANWDLLLVNQATGSQIGIEAKLSLNAKVLSQAIPGRHHEPRGPDFRAVLVPSSDLQGHISHLAGHLGIVVIYADAQPHYGNDTFTWNFHPRLPTEDSSYDMLQWPFWCPAERCSLPDYVPDVLGGKASPVALTTWKIRAIKLMIVLERRGHITRRDLKFLKLSESRWTAWDGFLNADRAKGGYVAGPKTPDLKAQHPINWAQIEADFAIWSEGMDPMTPALAPLL